MKDLIDKLLAALPMYGRQMTALLLGPKTAVLQSDLQSEDALQQGLTFLSVSVAITFIAEIPLLPGGDNGGNNKELTFGILAVLSALTFALNVALLVLVWRLAGAKGHSRQLLIASCYFCGVSTILFLGFTLVGAGAFKLLDPVGFRQTMSGAVVDPFDLANSGGYRVFILMLALGFTATYAWIILVWGAYRELLQISKARSAVALTGFVALSPFLIVIQMLMGYLVFVSRSQPAVPGDLLGTWQATSQDERAGLRSAETVRFTFLAPEYRLLPIGNYVFTDQKGSSNGKCVIDSLQLEDGWLLVQGSTMTLIPQKRNYSTRDGCAGTSWSTPKDRRKTEYQYQINRQSVGWTLCLSNRFGEHACLVAKKD